MATVNEKMTALADEVREISGSEELMGLDDMQQNLDVANENVQTESDLIEQIQVALENKISVDLSDYATIEYVDEAIAAADVGEDIYVQAEEPTNAEDGTVWIDLDENIEVKTPDTTLSIAGEPADAKAVGDALANKQPIGDYALKSDIPNDYLTEVPAEYITEAELNAKGYLTSFTETDPTVPAWAKTESKPVYTASEVGADAVGTANSAVSSHNSATDAHSDIRAKIGDLTALNTTAKDSLVTAINEVAASGGSGSGDKFEVLIVSIDEGLSTDTNMVATHSPAEILEAANAGKFIMFQAEGMRFDFLACSDTRAEFSKIAVEFNQSEYSTYSMNVTIIADKTMEISFEGGLILPSTGKVGQIAKFIGNSKTEWADPDLFIVTLDTTDENNPIASHSSNEIYAAANEGRIPVLSWNGGLFTYLSMLSNESLCYFHGTYLENFVVENDIVFKVGATKAVLFEQSYSANISTPTAEDAGKVLTATGMDSWEWKELTGGGGSGGSTTVRHVLFSNSALTSAFAGQTITIENLANYDEFYIECASDSQNMNLGIVRTTSTFEYSNGSTYVVFATFIYNGAAVQISRTLKISGNDIIISDCTMLSGETTSTSNQFLIPVKIVGKKYNIIGTSTLPSSEGVLL